MQLRILHTATNRINKQNKRGFLPLLVTDDDITAIGLFN